jgi:HEPN domain-containing protein
MDLQSTLNAFATEVFRKQADYDYVSARMNYRMKLRQQFLWSGHQAVEKYLKAILLFNGRSSRFPNSNGRSHEFQHDLLALHEEVKTIDYLKYELPNGSERFLAYLRDLGGDNRYMSRSSYSMPNAILTLDELVWNIRRYCRYIPDRGLGCKDVVPGMKQAFIRDINSREHKDNPCGFSLFRGELEEIVKRPKSDKARQALIWANFFYGIRNKGRVTYSPMSSSEVPPQCRSWFPKEQKDIDSIEKYIKLRTKHYGNT